MDKCMIHFRENFLDKHDTVQCFSMYHHCFVQNLFFPGGSHDKQVVKTGNDSSTAKRSATGVSVTGPQR